MNAAEIFEQIRSYLPEKNFSQIGKLRYELERRIKRHEISGQITPILKRRGLKDSMISHTAYAAKTFRLVASGQLTESEYDTIGIAAMWVMWVMWVKSSQTNGFIRMLSDQEIVATIREAPLDLESELKLKRTQPRIVA